MPGERVEGRGFLPAPLSTGTAAPTRARTRRDLRIDVLRGFALLTMFVDHIPGNRLALYTLHNFGFSDAAEIFVLLAGCSSMIAYGRSFDRNGVPGTLRRIGRRCLTIYLYQAALLLTTLLAVREWSAVTGLTPRFGVAPLLTLGIVRGMKEGLLLRALPNYIDILPLYIVLLASFPILYAGLRHAPALVAAVSGGLWLAANADHQINLPNVAVSDGSGWYFDPFAWQAMFAAGAALAVATSTPSGLLARSRVLAALSWAYLVFALLQSAPWTDWGLPDMRLFPTAAPDKSRLSPLQLIDSGAMAYLLFSSPAVQRLCGHGLFRPFASCGRHSLEVFAVGCLAALAGRMAFRSLGTGLGMQAAVNVLGMLAMVAVARGLDAMASKPGRRTIRLP